MIVLTFLLALLLCGCGENKVPVQPENTVSVPEKPISFSPEYGGMVTCMLETGNCMLDPLYSNDAVSNRIIKIIFNGLLTYDDDLNMVPDLADTWEVSADGREIVFYLRKGVKWHDGTDFTADDVVFTCRQSQESGTNANYRVYGALLDTVERIDDYTVKARYRDPSFLAFSFWKLPIIPRKAYSEAGKELFYIRPVGTGPFLLEDYSAGDFIILKSNRDFFRCRPFLERIKFAFSGDTSRSFLMLLNNEIDIMGLKYDYFVKQCNTESFRQKFEVLKYPSLRFFKMVFFNLDHELFQNQALRNALVLSADVEKLVEEVLYGFGKPISSPMHYFLESASRNISPHGYHPEEAASLFAQAGYTDTDGDGYLDRDGKNLEFSLLAAADNGQYSMVQKLLIDHWKMAGVMVNPVSESGTVVSDLMDRREFEAVLTGWVLDEEPQFMTDWHSSSIPSEKNERTGYNYAGLRDSQTDQIIEQMQKTVDYEKLMDLCFMLHKRILEKNPALFLYSVDSIAAVSRKIHAVKPTRFGIFRNLEQWYLTREE